jgi:diacylglycerol kinase family enzyme
VSGRTSPSVAEGANPPRAASAGDEATTILATGERRRIHVILNASAGTAANDPAEIENRLREAFHASGVAASIEVVRGNEIVASARRASDAAGRGTIDAIVVGGGDGTIHTIAGMVAGTSIPVGILPLGTLNHFARDVGVPFDLQEAVVAISTGHIHAVDVGEVNGQVFVNNSSVGLYPDMVLDRERLRDRSRHTKWIAMVISFLRVLRRFPRRRLRVKTEDEVATYRTPCLFVGNNRYDLSVGRRQALDGGLLHVCVARSSTRWGFLWFAIRTLLGMANRRNDLDELSVGSAEITTRAARLFVALDGEVERLATPLRYRIRPRALHVLLPRDRGQQ